MNDCSLVDLVGVGLNATDTVIPLEQFPERGSKSEYHAITVLPGGQVATTVVACQLWGLQTRYVGKLGDDEAAALHRREFAQSGVDARLITVDGGASPQSLIIVDGEGERTVLCRRDERLVLKAADLERPWIVNARALHIDGHDTEAATLAATWAQEAGVPVIADLDEVYPGIDELLEQIDYLIVSRDFPCQLMKEQDLEEALRSMQRAYKCRLTAATLGQDGVVAWDGRQLHYASAYRVPVVDTTACWRHFSRRLYLWFITRLEARTSTRLRLCGGCFELQGPWGPGAGSNRWRVIESTMAAGVRYAPVLSLRGAHQPIEAA